MGQILTVFGMGGSNFGHFWGLKYAFFECGGLENFMLKYVGVSKMPFVCIRVSLIPCFVQG